MGSQKKRVNKEMIEEPKLRLPKSLPSVIILHRTILVSCTLFFFFKNLDILTQYIIHILKLSLTLIRKGLNLPLKYLYLPF